MDDGRRKNAPFIEHANRGDSASIVIQPRIASSRSTRDQGWKPSSRSTVWVVIE